MYRHRDGVLKSGHLATPIHRQYISLRIPAKMVQADIARMSGNLLPQSTLSRASIGQILRRNKMPETQHQNTVVNPPTTYGSIENHIADVRQRWSAMSKNLIEIGEALSNLRIATVAYRKNHKSGMTYNQAVAKTGIPHATAELYRKTFELCKEHSISVTLYYALYDAGVNLGAKRYADIPATLPSGTVDPGARQAAASRNDVKSLDTSDEEAVKALVRRLEKDYPVDEGDGLKSFLSHRKSFAKDLQTQGEKFPEVAKALEKEIQDLDAKIKIELTAVAATLEDKLKEIHTAIEAGAEISETLASWLTKIA
jgi:hypothetical protein